MRAARTMGIDTVEDPFGGDSQATSEGLPSELYRVGGRRVKYHRRTAYLVAKQQRFIDLATRVVGPGSASEVSSIRQLHGGEHRPV